MPADALSARTSKGKIYTGGNNLATMSHVMYGIYQSALMYDTPFVGEEVLKLTLDASGAHAHATLILSTLVRVYCILATNTIRAALSVVIEVKIFADKAEYISVL